MIRLRTSVSPLNANHSFSGVFSDVHVTGREDVVLKGLSFAGEIGDYRVFFSPRSCLEGDGTPAFQDPSKWQLLAEGTGEPSLDFVVLFEEDCCPLIEAGQTASFYVHSAVLNDRGIMYQSFYSSSDVVAEDENLKLLPGVARLGSDPFENALQGGWYRKNRGFSGSMFYECIRLQWTWRRHAHFPRPLRQAVMAMLMLWNRSDCIVAVLPFDCLILIFEHLYWRDFEECEAEHRDDACCFALKRALKHFWWGTVYSPLDD